LGLNFRTEAFYSGGMSNIQRSQPRLCPCPSVSVHVRPCPSMSVRVRPCPSVSVRVRPCPSMRGETGNQTILGSQAISTSHDRPILLLVSRRPSRHQRRPHPLLAQRQPMPLQRLLRRQHVRLGRLPMPRPNAIPRDVRLPSRRHADSRIFTPPFQEPASYLNAKPQCPKDARTITIDKSQFPMDSPMHRRRVRGEKRKNDCLLCALGGSARNAGLGVLVPSHQHHRLRPS